MDEYAEYIYQRRPEYRHLSAGDVTSQKELRNKLNCKNFKWFMNEVAWDLGKFYPPVEPPAAAWGEVSLFKALSPFIHTLAYDCRYCNNHRISGPSDSIPKAGQHVLMHVFLISLLQNYL